MILLTLTLHFLSLGSVTSGTGQSVESVDPLVGIDVSHHQGEIDWAAVARAGIKFVYMKSSEGRDFGDRMFERNWTAARAQSVPAGAYHFFTFCSDGKAQAEFFLGTAPPGDDALRPAVDVEFVGNCRNHPGLKRIRRELKIFVDQVERAWGRKPLLYVTAESLRRVLRDDYVDYPLWIRSIGARPDLGKSRPWVIWQFSDSGTVPGISGPVDLNTLSEGRTIEDLVGSD